MGSMIALLLSMLPEEERLANGSKQKIRAKRRVSALFNFQFSTNNREKVETVRESTKEVL